MASYEKTIAGAKEKVAKAEARAFIARMEAIVAILQMLDRCAAVAREHAKPDDVEVDAHDVEVPPQVH